MCDFTVMITYSMKQVRLVGVIALCTAKIIPNLFFYSFFVLKNGYLKQHCINTFFCIDCILNRSVFFLIALADSLMCLYLK